MFATKSKPRCNVSRLATAIALAALSTTARAASRSYIGGDNSSFGTAANWNPAGTPGGSANDVLTVGDFTVPGLAGDLHVTINGLFGTTNTISSLNFDSSALPAALVVTETGGTINATTEIIGNASIGNTFNQGSGSANITTTLKLGVAAGTFNNFYNISDTGTTLSVSSSLLVGVDGVGVVTQSDGVVTVHNSNPGPGALLTLGVNSGSTGTYNLSSGNLTVDDFKIAGAGTGIFNQSGGTLSVTDGIFFVANAGQTATYNYSGGSATFVGGITAGSNAIFNLKTGGALPFNVAVNSGGTFNFAGGSFATGNATINSGGTFNLASGTFNAGTVTLTSGATFNFTGGTFGAGTIALNSGTINLQGHAATFSSAHITGTGTIQNGSTTTASTLTISPATTDSFGGTLADGSTAPLNVTLTTGTFTLSGSNSYSGTTTVSGGTFKAGGNLVLSSNSPVNLTGGTFDAQTFQNVIFSLTGTAASTVNINKNSGDLIVASSGANTTYAGKFTGSGELAVNGSNTLTLSGSGATSTFTGFIIVQNGTLAAGATDGMPTGIEIDLSGATAALSIPFNQHIATFNAGQNNAIIFSNNASLFVGASNNDSSIGGNFSGNGTLEKNGTGNLTIGLGSTDTNANTGSVGFSVNNGTLTLNKAGGTVSLAGDLIINGGTVILDASNQIASSDVFVGILGGTLDLNGFNQTLEIIFGNGGVLNVRTGTLTVPETLSNAYSGSLLGSGTFIKSPGGTLTLSNVASYTGTFSATGGTLTLAGSVAASSYSASNGAVIQFTGTALTTPATVNVAGGSITQTGAATLTVGAASGAASTITIGPGPASTFTTGTGLTSINATGVINQSDGTFTANGNITVTAGSYTQTGGTFTWANNKTMLIQSAGKVTLPGFYQTPNGATINVDGANSQFNISGTGSAYLTVGGNSTVAVTSGATVHSDLYFFIGTTAGPGTITVDGNNSSITSSALATYGENSLGTNGTGFLTLSSGATGNVPNGFQLGNAALSSGTLSVQSSAVLTTGPIDVGTTATNLTATLNVIGGTITQSGNATLAIGASSASTANVIIGPSGTLTTGTGNITINATGTLTLQSGGTLNVNGNVTNSGAVTLAGTQTWAASTSFTNNAGTASFQTDVGSNPTLIINGGSVLLSGNQHFNAITLNGGTLGGYGTVFAPLTLGTSAHTIAPSATLPSTSIGTLSLRSLTSNAHTTFAFNLKTPNLNINGSDKIFVLNFQGLNLSGGTLQITGSPVGFASIGYYKVIGYISTLQGAGIHSITLPAISNNISYTLDTLHDPGNIDVHRGFQGDANDDGTVTFADFVALSNNFGLANKGWPGGDFNGDGTTNFADFVLLSNNFGNSITGANLSADEIANFQSFAASFGQPASVPEPASLALLGLGPLMLLARTRKY